MRSSTSSSELSTADARAPALSWRRLWLVTLALVTVALAAGEAAGRLAGWPPYVSDDAGLWALQRTQVPRHDRRALVLAGRSRILVGMDLDVVRAVTGVTPIQLAIAGASPLPVLHDLAADASFQGRVICEFSEFDIPSPGRRPPPGHVDAYYARAFSADFERRVRLVVEEHVVYRSLAFAPRALAAGLWHGRLPQPPPDLSRRDRSRPIDYTRMIDVEGVRMRTLAVRVKQATTPPLSPAQFLQAAGEVEALVRTIQSRGGRVVLVRFPTSGGQLAFEESRLPKRLYWDALAAGASARMIHFQDHPELARYDQPDWSHLDRRDAPAFTRALLALLADELR